MSIFRRARYVLYVLLSVFCVLVFLPTQARVLWRGPKYPITTMDTDWTVTFNETVTTGMPLREVAMESVDSDDVLILTHTLPDEVPYGAMQMKTIRAAVDVFLDEEHIYSYGDASQRRMIFNNMHAIPLPEGYGGRQISILMRTNSNNAFAGMSPIYVGSQMDLLHYWLSRIIRPLFYGTFLLMFGVFMVILAIFMFEALSGDFRILVSAILIILFGLYALTYNQVFTFVFSNPAVNVFLEMTSLFLVPAAIASFLATIRGGMVQKIFLVLTIGNILMAVAFITLLFTGAAHTNQLLPFFHMTILVESILCLVLLWIDISSGRGVRPGRGNLFGKKTFMRRADRALFIGILSIILGGVADTIKYNISLSSESMNFQESTIDLTILGVLVFAGCLLLNYFFYTVEHANEIMTNRALADIAFTDPLTGLANRTRCEEVMRMLEEKHEDYSILSLDVQNLKKVNDVYGHGEGDRLLTGFADILREVFRESDLIGRIGGDEFIVVMRETPKSVCAQKEMQLKQVMERYNRTERVFRYEAACGYAHKSERLGATIRDIYRMADERMYTEKRRLHKERDEEVAHA